MTQGVEIWPRCHVRLRRIVRHGYTVGYETTDGRFRVENGLAGMRGGAKTPWTITARDDLDGMRLVLAGMDGDFRTLTEAREYLGGSMYARHSGWLAVPDAEVESDYAALAMERVEK